MNIFISGVAGFIGFSLADYFLKKNFTLYGIDNFDEYYSLKIKKKRLSILKKNKNFKFKNIDITNYKKIKKFIENKKIDVVIHLAAQAGVRYSLINPNKYLDTNITGFINLLKSIKNKKIKKFLYASSSSVYGDSNKFPLKENTDLKPKNIYGSTKRINELLADQYSKIYKIPFIGLRFFTIYGEWGRPDMFIFKLIKAHKKKKFFYLNNFGKHKRDFTYIGDVVKIINIITKKKIKNHNIFNICSNNPINILSIIKKFKKTNHLKLKLIKLNRADVLNTHGDNNKVNSFTKFENYSNFDEKFLKILKWYKSNKIDKL